MVSILPELLMALCGRIFLSCIGRTAGLCALFAPTAWGATAAEVSCSLPVVPRAFSTGRQFKRRPIGAFPSVLSSRTVYMRNC
uniref:Putative secreted protein n=1 Tax=Amblyomma cajennense TaxID=34607 RepID=A0A023FBD1_AMBCJ